MPTPQFAVIDHGETALTDEQTEAIIIGTVAGEDGLALTDGAAPVDAAFGGELTGILKSLGAKGKEDEVLKLAAPMRSSPAVVVAVGLGKPGDGETEGGIAGGITAESVRRASGIAARSLSGTTRAATTLSVIDLHAAVEGSALGAYAFTEYKSEAGDAPLAALDLVAPAGGNREEHEAAVTAAAAIAGSVIIARDLVNTPPNDLYPDSFAERARQAAAAENISVEVLDEQALHRGGYGGILGVGGGSSRGPRLVRLHYRARKPAASIALVGKGITFDTGGISIKPAAGMESMTLDMAGAAAVLATTVLAAKLNYPLEVTAYLPLAENMPSATAYRPGDVLRMYGGTTVEVLNTDAEGRLVLADALARALEDEPDYIIETSTLTGAQAIALGNRTPGVMGAEAFRDRVADIARRTGEGGWAMPLPEELRSELDSRVADIANITGNRWAGMLVAGVFLREFVGSHEAWAHIDIAGPAYNGGGPWGYTSKGGTGVPVRTLAAVLADIAADGAPAQS